MKELAPQLITCPIDAQPPAVTTTLLKPKYDALTSLRFFAAAMIVIGHSSCFFFGDSYVDHWQLGQGISFFFVLSGFILTCVYPELYRWEDIKQFLFARFSRIWPGHLVTACLTLVLLPSMYSSATIILTNLLLLQAWIPDKRYYYSLNSVSWTLSCEVFFYACFVWLIKPRKYELVGKIALALCILFACCLLANFFTQGRHHLELNRHFFLGVNPLIHLVEFIIGMITGKLWLRLGHLTQLDKWAATALEVAVFSVVIMEICLSSLITPLFALLFAVLILIAAMQQGYITKALGSSIFVWLGEISYSIYLVHLLLLRCFVDYIPEFGKLNCWLSYLVYWLLVILLSHLNYRLVEDPCRRAVKVLTSLSDKDRFFIAHLLSAFSCNLRPAIISILLAASLATATAIYIVSAQKRFHYVDLNVNHIYFGDRFVLEKVYLANAYDGSKIKLTWKSLLKQPLNRTVVYQLVDKDGQWLAEHDQQDYLSRCVHAGELWSETIYLPFNEIHRKGCTGIGLRLCIHQDHDSCTYLPINGGLADFWNTRLIVPLAKKGLLCQQQQ